MKKSVLRGLAGVAVVGLAVALAACSTPKPVATGSELHIWTMFPVTPMADVSQVGAGVKAGAAAINAAGGLGKQHHKLVVKECKTDFSPQSEIQCAQQASDDALSIAFVSPLQISGGDAVDKVLQDGELPVINSNPNTPEALKSPVQFPIAQDVFNLSMCTVMGAKASGAKSVAYGIVTNPGTVASAERAVALAGKNGVESLGVVEAPLSTTDIAPFLQQAVDLKPELLVPSLSPMLMAGWLSGLPNSGFTGASCVTDELAPYQVLVGLGAAAKDIYMVGSYPEYTWDYPLLKQFNADAAAEAATGDKYAATAPGNSPMSILRGWLGTYVLQQAVANVEGDTLDRATLLAALNKTTVTFGEGNPIVPIDFSKPNPDPEIARLFNTSTILKVWNPDTKTIDQTKVGPMDASQLK